MNKPIKQNILKVYGREPETLNELARCVIHIINSQENGDIFDRKRRSVAKYHKVIGFAWDIKHSEMVSNTHSSPEGYPQNWRQTNDAPKGYPGWFGRVWIRYNEECRSFASDPFTATLTRPGTGGFGGYDGPWEKLSSTRFKRYSHSEPKGSYPEPKVYSWDYRFYDLDWPLIALWVEKQKMWAELSGQKWDNSHKFAWNDPDVLIKDSAFVAECVTIKAKETV